MSLYCVFINSKKKKTFVSLGFAKRFVLAHLKKTNAPDNEIWIYKHSVFQNRITHFINYESTTETWRTISAW